MKIILHTERLYLREMTVADAENAYRLNLDPEVIRYTGDTPFSSVEEARQFLEQYDHYARYGFGRWAVCLRDGGTFLGWCGLKYTEAENEYDIGFRFLWEHWGKGYATEAAKACLHLGFERFGIPEILGHAMTDNTGSIRVLEKIGLQFLRTFEFEGQEGVIYGLKAPGNYETT